MAKVAILGLDSMPPAFFFGKHRADMPNLARLMSKSLCARLESTHPPITVPAWTSMMSSKDPGQLGFYGFRNRKDHSYDGYQFANATQIHEPLTWDVLGRHGKKSLLVGVPQTYPPRPIDGAIVSCFLTPSTKSEYTYPKELKAEVERVSGGYVLDVEDFRTPDKADLLKRIYDKTRKHFAVGRHLLATRPWDFFMLVEMGVDRIHHAFWSYADPEHHKFVPGNPYVNSLRDYYRFLDAEIGQLLALLPADTILLVVSDHGSKKMDGGICFNEWLIAEGYLTLAEPVDKPTPIGKVKIDWSRTRAWGDGGYYGRLFMNVRGREPAGVIDPADYEAVRREIAEKIAAINDPQGRNIGCKAYRPEDLYRTVNGVAPDLVVYFGDLDWRSVGAVGLGSIHTFENDTGPDEANHDWHGIFMLYDPSRPRAEPSFENLPVFQIYDVAPTVLAAFGLPVPSDMIGKSRAYHTA
jgi:predicted AlkP superfamily phosphohydrolase/phosphomutase